MTSLLDDHPSATSLLDTISAATTLEQLSADTLEELQTALKSLGYGLDVDGKLGPLTKSVWASFKVDNNLGQPDSIGPASIAVLKERLAGGSVNDVPSQAVGIVKTFEGFRTEAYDDGTGVWTIGYGTTKYADGRSVQRGQTATETQAVEYLTNDLKSTVKALASSVPYWITMIPNQHAALISFGYNLGAGFYGAADFNSISGALRNHRWSDIPSVFALYSMPNTVVHQGLLRRRIAEGDLWQGNGPFASSA